ncbi:MAG: alpha-glucan family phosphorylase [Dehalococcoidales bacterium]|nr:alpha-glucan family phosphorylase [Dehalococcoidales bacterium]
MLKIPKRIGRLDELANNLWWSWHEEARNVFRMLDYPLWRINGHNPVKQLCDVSEKTLQAAANDQSFLTCYDSVMSLFDAYLASSNTWGIINFPELSNGPIAYFSMEYAIQNSLPIYAGGLGILAGDICKEASDLGLPLVAVGFIYPQGYFHQNISEDGWQQEIYQQLIFEESPIERVFSTEGNPVITKVQLGNDLLSIGVWKVQVGRTKLYLLDTNLEENPAHYRQLSSRLYVADREVRIQQEIILGIGGVRILRTLGITPSIWHSNEGHTAFMMLERIREEIANGKLFEEAKKNIQRTTVFTTHTPILAGHDIFPTSLMDQYFKEYQNSLCIDRKTFLQLGQQDKNTSQPFNMTILAIKLADKRCAVSQLHGEITRKMWRGLWPDTPENQVPISHITNGIHVPTWIAPELLHLLNKYLGEDWIKEHDNIALWDNIQNIPDNELWETRQLLKRKLVAMILDRAQKRWISGEVTAHQVLVMGALLDPAVLTIAFTRRFTEYKRPSLIFTDIARLKRIINNQWRPVQIIFAGKSHPADFPSKYLLQHVYALAKDRDFQGRIAFIEDYDMHMSRYLVHGTDLWLNNPHRLREACGTSGMKAALNGSLHLSICDGWWCEGYNGSNGWTIGNSVNLANSDEQDKADAESLYHLLEEEIIPLYYTRDRNGVPHGWIRMIKEAMRTITPIFSARRMLKEYAENMYIPASQSLKKKV